MQTIDEVKRHCREVGEGIVAAVAAGEDQGAKFEGAQGGTFRIEKNGSEIEVVGGVIAQVKMMGGDVDGGDDSTKKGFTLIEVLVLLAIFGVLAFVIKGCFFGGSSNKPIPKQAPSSGGLVRIITQPQFVGNFVIRMA